MEKSQSFIHKSYNTMTHTEELTAEIKALNEKKEAIELEIFNLNIKRKFNLKNIRLKEEELSVVTEQKPTATEAVGMINEALK
jgi:hypothetical protein